MIKKTKDDLKYIAERNKHIPAAEAYANSVAGERPLALHPEWLKTLTTIPIKRIGRVFMDCHRTTLRVVLVRACKKAGLPPISLHEFGRHSFIQQRVVSGWTTHQIASVTNNARSIEHYIHDDPAMQRAVIENKRYGHDMDTLGQKT